MLGISSYNASMLGMFQFIFSNQFDCYIYLENFDFFASDCFLWYILGLKTFRLVVRVPFLIGVELEIEGEIHAYIQNALVKTRTLAFLVDTFWTLVLRIMVR